MHGGQLEKMEKDVIWGLGRLVGGLFSLAPRVFGGAPGWCLLVPARSTDAGGVWPKGEMAPTKQNGQNGSQGPVGRAPPSGPDRARIPATPPPPGSSHPTIRLPASGSSCGWPSPRPPRPPRSPAAAPPGALEPADLRWMPPDRLQVLGTGRRTEPQTRSSILVSASDSVFPGFSLCLPSTTT